MRKVFTITAKAVTLLLLGAIIGGSVWTYFNYRSVLDIYAYNSTPKHSIAGDYSKVLDLTPRATLMLYGTYPEVEEKIQFNIDCEPFQNVIELGCYITGKNKIHVLNITEPNLKNVVNVTLAHELLHAGYARLPQKQKEEVNKLLEAQVLQIHDSDLTDRLKAYALSEPAERDNELYSIFGSEYPTLSKNLEDHYKVYFKNRVKITDWHIADTNYLASKEDILKTEKANIDNDQIGLDNLNKRMIVFRNSDRIGEYNALVPEQNALVAKLRSEISEYNNNVTAYNDIISSLNSRNYSTYDENAVQ